VRCLDQPLDGILKFGDQELAELDTQLLDPAPHLGYLD